MVLREGCKAQRLEIIQHRPGQQLVITSHPDPGIVSQDTDIVIILLLLLLIVLFLVAGVVRPRIALSNIVFQVGWWVVLLFPNVLVILVFTEVRRNVGTAFIVVAVAVLILQLRPTSFSTSSVSSSTINSTAAPRLQPRYK